MIALTVGGKIGAVTPGVAEALAMGDEGGLVFKGMIFQCYAGQYLTIRH